MTPLALILLLPLCAGGVVLEEEHWICPDNPYDCNSDKPIAKCYYDDQWSKRTPCHDACAAVAVGSFKQDKCDDFCPGKEQVYVAYIPASLSLTNTCAVMSH